MIVEFIPALQILLAFCFGALSGGSYMLYLCYRDLKQVNIIVKCIDRETKEEKQ